MKINFVDQFTDYVLKVDDFRELGYIYQQYTNNGSFTNCKECGRLIKKTNNKCLYCNDCKVLISARQKRDWDLKNRISEKQKSLESLDFTGLKIPRDHYYSKE